MLSCTHLHADLTSPHPPAGKLTPPPIPLGQLPTYQYPSARGMHPPGIQHRENPDSWNRWGSSSASSTLAGRRRLVDWHHQSLCSKATVSPLFGAVNNSQTSSSRNNGEIERSLSPIHKYDPCPALESVVIHLGDQTSGLMYEMEVGEMQWYRASEYAG